MKADLNAGELMKEVTVTVSLDGIKVLRWRLWVASWFFRAGAWVAGCTVILKS